MTPGFRCELCGATVPQERTETRVDGAILAPGQVRCATCNVEMRAAVQIENPEGQPLGPPSVEA